MLTITPQVRTLAESGFEFLNRGDAKQARGAFEQLVAAGAADAFAFVGLAYACRSLGDRPAAHAAIDRALALEPRNLRALILKADHLAEERDVRAASSFYLAAVQAAPSPERLPADLREELRRAKALCDQYAGQFEGFLMQRLGERGLADRPSTRRFTQSLDVLFGRKSIYVQQPRYYYFPALPQIQFYERSDFPWLDGVEAACADIKAELVEVLKQASAFEPYLKSDQRRPYKPQDGMLDNPAWSAFYLWKDGEIVPENAARCPKTLRALEAAPLASVKNRSPSILFSLLRPGAHIPAHSGLVNTRLICHLPLIVPPRCRFRVGNETREVVEGKAWVFDDTIEHEAWNDSDRTRVILLFEIWRPELTAEERGLVTTLFEAIDAHSGTKPAWEI